ncbi:hypothetical protein, unlikely [Trypanosoma brucei gambiense DAL972]|uniref:Uncharacterized protein n=1 Tax=Trypanosoma brucei gambiense (strain MHOM/CI/86/DAL972) TaxID=679716 RepID=C9ZU07_TRYB9|nr:hypothetical protein, unlikely [Trypanosoma brucei gambiense DAL972]CBH12893.1 hypothetical protein, unlikely [Trypanosoma brucei gambiense DAL972]|eukprot:XP_011775172.1 hypothetical protein, unlikely [Trypanosoma brucei gambiense DAL972]
MMYLYVCVFNAGHLKVMKKKGENWYHETGCLGAWECARKPVKRKIKERTVDIYIMYIHIFIHVYVYIYIHVYARMPMYCCILWVSLSFYDVVCVCVCVLECRYESAHVHALTILSQLLLAFHGVSFFPDSFVCYTSP